ncbi:MAG: lasso peptide biosynthesis B2 protein [Thermoplasmatota archaeon]
MREAARAFLWAGLYDRVRPYPKNMARLGPLGPPSSDGEHAPGVPPSRPLREVMQAYRAVRRRWPWHLSCRAEALAAHRMLSRRGLPTVTAIGVAVDDDGVTTSHAWLSCEGHVVTGRGAQGHQVIGERRSG